MVNDSGRGKGNALYTGFRNAAGDVIVTFDSDGSHHPEDIGRFLEEMENGAGLVIGSRVLGGSDDHNVIRLFANGLFTMLFSILFGTTLMDTLNGYKAFAKEVVSGYRPRARGFDVEVEIVARALGKGLNVSEIASHEDRRSGGRMKSHAIRDGFHILTACLREGLKFRIRRLFRRRPA
jgi:glycosyltransferase involved in cell wall biosynthesis